MSTLELIKEFKKIYELIIDFLENEGDESFTNLIELVNELKIQENILEFDLLLRVLNEISNNHFRGPNFISKIERILLHFKEQIRSSFSPPQLARIFKENKRVLLFLIEEEVIAPDVSVLPFLNCYSEFFSPEIAKIESREQREESQGDFGDKRRLGENDSRICELIRGDMIDEFVTYATQAAVSADSIVGDSIFETNRLLLAAEATTLIEYAAFFGSVQIFQHLMMMQAKIDPRIWLYAVHGRSPDIIHILEGNLIQPNEKNDFQDCFDSSVECHHNEIAAYIENKQDLFNHSIRYYNFQFIQYANEACFYDLCAYNYLPFVDLILKNVNYDINKQTIPSFLLMLEFEINY